MTAYHPPAARTSIPATYRTDTFDPPVFFTALTEDGTILVDRTSVGVTLTAPGLYEYIVPVDATTDTFIARWDENEGDPTTQYDEELIVVPRGDRGATGATGAPGSGAVASVAGKTGIVTLVEGDIASLVADLAAKAPTASPAFTGTPSLPTGTTASTQSAADSSTKLATTAFVTTADNLKANLASPTFTGTPSLPTGTTAVTQAANNNSTKVATTAYADAAGGGSVTVNQPWTYFAKTNGTTVTLYDAGGAVVTSGTDLGAIFNARVASRQQWVFGPGDFPITTTLSIPDETYIGINLVGSGGLMNMNIQNITQTPGVTRFVYTPNSGTVLEVLKAQGVFVRDIHFQATSTTWTGTILDFHGDYTTSPHKTTRHCGLERCTLMARKGDTTAPLLNVSTVVGFTATKCLFHGGRLHVRGVTDATGFAASEVADEVSFYNCRFQYPQNATYPIISNILKNWAFNACVFEQGANTSFGVPLLIQDSGVPGGNVSFNDCFGSDWTAADNVNQAMITYNGTALAIRNFYIYLPNGQSLVKTNDTTGGIYVSGLYFPNGPTTPTLVTVASGAATDVVIEANQVIPAAGTYLSGVTTQPPLINRTPYKTLSADTTLTHQDHKMLFGVSASGAARTITLPAVTCVGLTVMVKKTDSSGNAVTVARAGSATIDGATSVSLATQYKSVSLVSDGTNWQITGQV